MKKQNKNINAKTQRRKEFTKSISCGKKNIESWPLYKSDFFRSLRLCAFAFLSIFYLFASSCSSEPRTHTKNNWLKPNGKIKILSTTAMINDLVKEVVAEYGDTDVLISGQLDPHSYQLVKGDNEKLLAADLIFCNGLHLEHGPSLRQFLSTTKKAVVLGDLLREDAPDLILYHQGTVDPHIWMDMSLWLQTIKFIVKALVQLDPAHEQEYIKNGSALQQKLAASHETFLSRMESIPEKKRYLITSHDAFYYFARAYLATEEERKAGGWQKRFAAPEGLAPESQLSAAEIQNILSHMQRYDIRVIFPESNVSQASIKKLLHAGKKMGLDLIIAPESLYGDAMGAPGSSGETYTKMIEHNIEAMIKLWF